MQLDPSIQHWPGGQEAVTGSASLSTVHFYTLQSAAVEWQATQSCSALFQFLVCGCPKIRLDFFLSWRSLLVFLSSRISSAYKLISPERDSIVENVGRP